MLSVDLDSAVPPFEQIRAQIAQQAAAGLLPPGTRLPSIRQLSRDLSLAPGTVARAYRELEATGIISARGRHGSFIATGARSAPAAERERATELRAAAAEYACKLTPVSHDLFLCLASLDLQADRIDPQRPTPTAKVAVAWCFAIGRHEHAESSTVQGVIGLWLMPPTS